MQSIFMHTKMELRLLSRDIIGLFFVFIMPALCFYFFGKLFETQHADDLQYFNQYIPGMIGVVLFTAGFYIVGLQAVIDREKGVYKRLKGTPVRTVLILQAMVIKGLFAVIIGSIEILLIGHLGLDAPLNVNVMQFLLSMLLAASAFIAVGFIVASLFQRVHSALAIGFVMLYPMLFLSGATIPIESLPSSLKAVSVVIPLRYAVHLLQNGWSGRLFTASSIGDASVLFVILAIGIILGRNIFKWDRS
ncbi:ABC-2 type transport system permease protein [Paenibacillus cellulosilyticus]|uniref:Transport permease protein n=1 Tax=Paenibacillus cellulosilyticus TaxID=375489 RepID=A0A2V2YH26_9BACL|nr:ABC transporter permease [Paenibacillus cellulosilyticus]PWV92111.1 ABC-2 type transport system permease protein [Paenibacillus cellulosilyticus]QKS44219.1 ABC transporter permease [Paenibacillus cellulosilyticus]